MNGTCMKTLTTFTLIAFTAIIPPAVAQSQMGSGMPSQTNTGSFQMNQQPFPNKVGTSNTDEHVNKVALKHPEEEKVNNAPLQHPEGGVNKVVLHPSYTQNNAPFEKSTEQQGNTQFINR